MKIKLNIALFLSAALLLTACARDVYPKYLRMKQEAVWIEKSCKEGLASETRYVYKGSGASIWITCKKPLDLRIWRGAFDEELKKGNWLLKKPDVVTEIYCLGNEGISLLVTPAKANEDRSFVLSYPTNNCSILKN